MEMLDLAWPFHGRWVARNSPADRVPSHGTAAFGVSHAVDFVPVDAHGRAGAWTWRSLIWTEAAEQFPGFGRPILAPVAGRVVSARDGEPDRPAHRGLSSLPFAWRQRERIRGGLGALAGNHVALAVHGTNVIVLLAHLRLGSVDARAGRWVDVGDRLGACGNSGNSTHPHLHVQASTSLGPDARGIPIRFAGQLPAGGEVIDV